LGIKEKRGGTVKRKRQREEISAVPTGAPETLPPISKKPLVAGLWINDFVTADRLKMSSPVIKCRKPPRKKCRFMAEVKEKR